MRFQVADPNIDPDEWTDVEADAPGKAALAYARASLDPDNYDRPFPLLVRGPHEETTVVVRAVPAHFEVT